MQLTTVKYDDMTTIEKADAHINDARNQLGLALGLVGQVQSQQVLNGRLREDQSIAIANVAASIALANTNIALFLLSRQMWEPNTQSIPLFKSELELVNGQEGNEEVPQESSTAS